MGRASDCRTSAVRPHLSLLVTSAAATDHALAAPLQQVSRRCVVVADRGRWPGHEYGFWTCCPGLAEHLRLLHVLLPHFRDGRGNPLRARSPTDCQHCRPHDDRAGRVADARRRPTLGSAVGLDRPRHGGRAGTARRSHGPLLLTSASLGQPRRTGADLLHAGREPRGLHVSWLAEPIRPRCGHDTRYCQRLCPASVGHPHADCDLPTNLGGRHDASYRGRAGDPRLPARVWAGHPTHMGSRHRRPLRASSRRHHCCRAGGLRSVRTSWRASGPEGNWSGPLCSCC